MTRDMYLRAVDRPLVSTAQVDDLMSVIPGYGLGKALAGKGMAAAHGFLRTEALAGRASAPKVGDIVDSMRAGGWKGAPIKAVEQNGQKYVIDGHHRLEAARRAGIDVSYEIISPSDMAGYGYQSVDDVVRAASEVGPNRLR